MKTSGTDQETVNIKGYEEELPVCVAGSFHSVTERPQSMKLAVRLWLA